MDLKRLAHIVALADEGNFSRAAKRVHLSQPAFSRSIQAAEEEAGVKLFERGPGNASCTPAGEFFVERARRLISESRRLERDVQLFREGMIGKVCIGAGPFVAASLLPPVLASIRSRFPEVEMHVRVNSAHALLEGVRSEDLDFFIGDTRDVPRDGVFDVRKVGAQPGGLYVQAGHPLAARKTVRIAEALAFGLATGRLPKQLNAALLKMIGLPPDGAVPVALDCDDTHVLRLVAMNTDTVMVASDDILRNELKQGSMKRLELSDFAATKADMGIVSIAGRTHSPLATHAIDELVAAAKLEARGG